MMETLNCGALNWEGDRWEGNLHFPEGVVPVYLVPTAGGDVRFYIRDARSATTIGVLFADLDTFYGRLNTSPAIALQGWVTQNKRFVLRRKAKWLGAERYPVTLHYTPYAEGEAYRP